MMMKSDDNDGSIGDEESLPDKAIASCACNWIKGLHPMYSGQTATPCIKLTAAPPIPQNLSISESIKKLLQMHTKPPALYFQISLPFSMHLVHQDAATVLLSIFR